MIYVISKSTCGSYNVRDIQCNANWDCCPYSDYALIPDNLVDGILATKGYCDITLNSAKTEVTSFTARAIPSVPEECCAEDIMSSTPKTKKGDIITVNDSGDLPLHGLKLYGKTSQNGTPSPDAPVALESVGSDGNINLTVAGTNRIVPYAKGTNQTVALAALAEDTEAGTWVIRSTRETQTYFSQCYWTWQDSSLAGKTAFFSVDDIVSSNPSCSERVYLVALSDINDLSSTLYTYWLNRDRKVFQFTVPEGTNGFYIMLRIDQFNADVAGDTLTVKGMRLNIGDRVLPYEPPEDIQTLTVSTPNGLPGIPVTAGGNYTDETGQQWLCNYRDYARGVEVNRLGIMVCDGSADEKWQTSTGQEFFIVKADMPHPHKAESENVRCSHFGQDTKYASVVLGGAYGIQALNTGIPSLADWKAWLAKNPITVIYELERPIETALPAEEMAAFASLRSNKPNTTVYNDGVVGMAVSYFPQNAAIPVEYGTGRAGHVLTVAEDGCITSVPKANMPYVYDFGYIGEYTSDETWKSLLNECLSKMPRNGVSTATMLMVGTTIALEIYKFDEEYAAVKQRYVSSTDTVVVQERIFYNDWGEWEWENPPMMPSVEYRTTERWNGKAVYTKLIAMGSYTSGTMRVEHGCGDITPIRCLGVQGNITIPMHLCDSEYDDSIVGIYANRTHVIASANSESPNGVNVTAQIWYVKN